MLAPKSIIICVLFLFVSVGQINAISVDTVTSTSDFTLAGARTAPVTVPHSISNAQEVLYVGVSNNRTTTQNPLVGGCPVALPVTGTVPPGGLSYGGRTDFERYTTPTTNLNAVVSPNFCTSVEIFRLKNPPTGANTLSVTVTGGGDYLVIGAISFTGVDSSTTTAGMLAPASGSDRFPTVTVPTPNNGLVLDVIAAEFVAGRTIPAQTLRWNGQPTFGALTDIGAGSTKAITGASTQTNWTLDNAANWALGGVAIKEVVLASPASIGGRVGTKEGEPLKNVLITLRNLQTGEVFNATTNEKGVYYFEGLALTNLYQIKVFSNFYAFSPNNRILNLTESLEEINFYGVRRNRKERFF